MCCRELPGKLQKICVRALAGKCGSLSQASVELEMVDSAGNGTQ